jgi:hypothetical protein
MALLRPPLYFPLRGGKWVVQDEVHGNFEYRFEKDCGFVKSIKLILKLISTNPRPFAIIGTGSKGGLLQHLQAP